MVARLVAFATVVASLALSSRELVGQDAFDTRRGDRMIAAYFAGQTRERQSETLADIETLDDWKARRGEYRRQLFEMLGLEPLPEKTDLQATITGTIEADGIVVERLHFQSRPGLHVTGNLYRPKEATGPLPTVLYVCGHGRVKDSETGISFGNKVHYHHHGVWFARNGYVCLTIDTLQLGEIEGTHHGTYRYHMWWWLNRGYTPAGVEAWNCIRALDYLESRPEVDGERIGVTGRSGGGAYSWWIAALDDRIKVAVPVAGITDLENHVVDGCVEGHCDCMYMVNTYRWDYSLVAALVAPRPLLISNTDSDRIFPLDGVTRTFNEVRRIYRLYDAADQVALNITAGPHKDTQELRVSAFRWFNHHLKEDDSLIRIPAEKVFSPQQLRVFAKLPDEQRNTEIHETFTAVAPSPALPDSRDDWDRRRKEWMRHLRRLSFAAWPAEDLVPLNVAVSRQATRGGLRVRAIDFTPQAGIRLTMYEVGKANAQDARARIVHPLDEDGWERLLATLRRGGFQELLAGERATRESSDDLALLQQIVQARGVSFYFVLPRGVGPTAWDQSAKKQTQHRRRFYLLGQTRDGMQVWDLLQAMRCVVEVTQDNPPTPLIMRAERRMAGLALYATLMSSQVKVERLQLIDLPTNHRDGPILLNVDRVWTLPTAVAAVATTTRVELSGERVGDWVDAEEPPIHFVRNVLERIDRPEKALTVRR